MSIEGEVRTPDNSNEAGKSDMEIWRDNVQALADAEFDGDFDSAAQELNRRKIEADNANLEARTEAWRQDRMALMEEIEGPRKKARKRRRGGRGRRGAVAGGGRSERKTFTNADLEEFGTASNNKGKERKTRADVYEDRAPIEKPQPPKPPTGPREEYKGPHPLRIVEERAKKWKRDRGIQ